jgi:aminopeptidase N
VYVADSTRIDGEIVKSTSEIVLNTLELKLLNAKIVVSQGKSDESWESTTFAEDTKTQRSTITFPQELPVSSKASLTIDFTGLLNHDMAGFYRSQYKPAAPAAASVPRDDEFHYMLSTQFEACDARRAFPCFDEPNLKATFDFAIEIPEDQVALSNMPAKETKPVDGGKKVVSFERSPVMSTYLLAWAVGDFEYVEAFTSREYNGKKLPVRVYTTRGLKEQGRWALEHAPKIIDYFSEQFEIDYPLPKSDILAVHEFTHGAMENWGLVTYRMTAILFDEKLSEARFRNRIAYVVAHELAHQWFGNLVTMDWWDELWLNEGFATWAGWLATDHLHPDWEVWPQFINEGMDQAFSLDSVRSSHPIQVEVRDALDVNQIFDKISYLKGCSMIRMLASNLGIKTFLKGIAIYLKKHAYGNAKTEALWNALSEASGVDVNSMMQPWIEKVGFPVLTVTEGKQQISVKQSRFLSTGDVKPEDDQTTWWVPLAVKGKVGSQGIEPLTLTTKESTIDGISDEFYQLNANATGFYRVNYPESRLKLLGTQLQHLTTEDKIFITGSAADLAFSGYATTGALLSFIQGLKSETHYRVLSQALDSIATLKSIFGDDEVVKKGLERFTLELIDKALKQVSWEGPKNEDFNTSLLRKRLLLTAVANSHEEYVYISFANSCLPSSLFLRHISREEDANPLAGSAPAPSSAGPPTSPTPPSLPSPRTSAPPCTARPSSRTPPTPSPPSSTSGTRPRPSTARRFACRPSATRPTRPSSRTSSSPSSSAARPPPRPPTRSRPPTCTSSPGCWRPTASAARCSGPTCATTGVSSRPSWAGTPSWSTAWSMSACPSLRIWRA